MEMLLAMSRLLLRLLQVIFIFLYCARAFAEHNSFPLIKENFDISMGIKDTGRYHLMMRDSKRSKKYMNFFRNLYDANFLAVAESNSVIIPKIIHHIWIGPRKFPNLYAKYAKTCMDHNPGWQYKLWTNDDIENILAINPKYIPLFKKYQEVKSYPGQKDLLEFLILYKHGGVFLDADVECVRSFDSLAYNYDFFSALEPGNGWSKVPIMTNAIVGTKPNNKIFLDTLDDAMLEYSALNKANNTAAKVWFRKIMNEQSLIALPDPRNVFMMTLESNLVDNNNLYNKRSIVFPATYFNPVFPGISYNVWDNFLYKIGYYKNKNSDFKDIKPETIAVQDFYDGDAN
jgi:hypothetical protein